MKLSVIIINWNAAADTIRCVSQVVVWQRVRPTVWVVDNGSTDGSVDVITRQCPEVNLIKSSENVGYAAANNIGLIAAIEHSNTPILLLNNDASIAESDVLLLLDILHSNPQIGVVGPLLFDAEQPGRLLTAGGQNIIRHLKSHIPTIKTEDKIQFVDYVPGTVLLAKAEVFQTVGLLDEAYFFSGELPDWCHRARHCGCRSAVYTEAKAHHAVSRSSRFRDSLYTYYIIRNRFLFIRKFLSLPQKFAFGSFWAVYSLALAIKLAASGKQYTTKAILLGLFDGLRGQFGGQNERVLTACRVWEPGFQTPATPQP